MTEICCRCSLASRTGQASTGDASRVYVCVLLPLVSLLESIAFQPTATLSERKAKTYETTWKFACASVGARST